MRTKASQRPGSFYDTPFGRLCERDGLRRPQSSVAELMVRLVGAAR